MGTAGTTKKADLQDAIDIAIRILTAPYVPEAERETPASAVGDELAALERDLEDNDVDNDEDDGDNDDYDAA